MDTTFSTFFGSGNGYVTYVQQLQSATNSASPSDVLTTSMVNGSINSNSAINVPDSSDNSATLSAYNGLNSLLSSGSIGGATILSYTITASGGDLPSEGVNLALILGITIPLGIILIIAIGVLIYCKYKKSSNIIERKIQEDGLTVRETFELSNDMTGRKLEAI